MSKKSIVMYVTCEAEKLQIVAGLLMLSHGEDAIILIRDPLD